LKELLGVSGRKIVQRNASLLLDKRRDDVLRFLSAVTDTVGAVVTVHITRQKIIVAECVT